MSFGDCAVDADLSAAWKQFCRRLEEAGDQAFKATIPANPLQRADTFRFLTQNLGQAFDLALETKNTQYPVIHAFCTPFCKLGGDNAEYTYQQAWIDRNRSTAFRAIAAHLASSISLCRVHGRTQILTSLAGAISPTNPSVTHPGQSVRARHADQLGRRLRSLDRGEKRGPNWLPTSRARVSYSSATASTTGLKRPRKSGSSASA